MKIVFYDLEMVCYEHNKDVGEIIEIGAVLVDLTKKEILKTASVLVKPAEAITPFTTKITGITQKMVDKEGVSLPEAIRRIGKKISLNNHSWFAWGRDITTINKEFIKHGIKVDVGNFHNLAVFMRALHNESRNLGLVDACAYYGAEVVTPAHRALPDAISTGNLAIKMFSYHRSHLKEGENAKLDDEMQDLHNEMNCVLSRFGMSDKTMKALDAN